VSGTGAALVLASVWLSPPALLGLAVFLFDDGTHGLWPFAAMAAAVMVVALGLGAPWSHRDRRSVLTASGLVRRRWPAAAGDSWSLALADAASAALFAAAQLVALREIGRVLAPLAARGAEGLPAWTPVLTVGIGAGLAGLAGWRNPRSAWLARVGSAVFLAALGAGLIGILIATTPRWDRVWAEVASRPRVIFPVESPWVSRGHPVRAVAGQVEIDAPEEQRVTLLGEGAVRLDARDGIASRLDVTAPLELTLRAGDRLVVPDGFPLRFEAGRRIPGAPATGPDWADPAGHPVDWRSLVGLCVTLLVGALGLAPLQGSLAGGPETGAGATRTGAGIAIAGLGCTGLWVLYAAWLTPEIYVGGVAGIEIWELPARVGALGSAGPVLLLATLGGLGAGAVAGAAASRRALAGLPAIRRGHVPIVFLGALATGAALAIWTAVRPWTVLVTAFGIGASASAPAAILGCWSERVTARALRRGAWVGLAVFGGAGLLGLVLPTASAGDSGWTGWVGWIAGWPALAGVPANALVVWVSARRAGPGSGSPLPSGLAGLHD
jgi:hypothetical protein